MISVIVVFSKMENAKSIKNILVKGGFDVCAACTSGAHALQYANELGDGIVVCGGQLRDMMYEELYQYLPSHFAMLLVASASVCGRKDISDIISLPMPLKVEELFHSVEMIEGSLEQKKKRRKFIHQKRNEAEEEMVHNAKQILMKLKGMTEEEAYRYIQKNSMDSGVALIETAQMVLSMMDKNH